MKRLRWLGSIGVALAMAASPTSAIAQYVYTGGNIVTDVSASTCYTSNVASDDAVRSIGGGVTSSATSQNHYGYYCPLPRRNTHSYGAPLRYGDRVLMIALSIKINDGDSGPNGYFPCTAYVNTAIGGTYWSETRYSCSAGAGCSGEVQDSSWVGTGQLAWSYPFGTSAILDQGAVNVGYACALPASSSIYWATATFAPNQ